MARHSNQSYSDDSGLITFREVSERLAVSAATVRRLVAAGELPRVKVGGSIRFEMRDVDALIQRGKETAGSASPDATREIDEDPAGRPDLVPTLAERGQHDPE